MSTRTRLALSLLSLTACSKLPPGEPVTFDTVCSAQYAPAIVKGLESGKRLTLVGRLSLGKSTLKVCSNQSCDALLLPDPDSTARAVRIDLDVGNGRNQMERLPKKFTHADFKVRTVDKQVVGEGARVKLTGRRYGGSTLTPGGCWLSIDTVEAQ